MHGLRSTTSNRPDWRWWIGVPLLLIAIAGVGWMYMQASHARSLAHPGRARQEGRPIPVRTALVREMASPQMIGGTGVTVASETALVQIAPVRAKAADPVAEVVIKRVFVKDGDYVRRHQVLFEFDDVVPRAILRQRQVELTGADGVLRSRAEDLTHQQKLFDMARSLTDRGLMAQAQLLEAESRLLAARTVYEEAKARVNLLRSDTAVAQRDVSRFRFTSPIDGFASGVEVVPGTMVTQPTILAKVLKLNPIHVLMDFPQEHLRDVFVGQKAATVLDSFPQESFEGRVVRIMPEAKRELRVLPVLIEIPNPGHRVKAGISGFSRLSVAGRKAIGVPETGVVEQGTRAMTFRVEEGRARLREIRVGAVLENGWREVLEGLAPGDQVVIFHNFYRDAGKLTLKNSYLQDNDRVDVDWRKWTRRE